MKTFFYLLLCLTPLSAVSVERTIVLYNSSSAESKFVAQHYQKKRRIAETMMIGLPMPSEGTISIADYKSKIEAPLKKALTEKELWRKNADGIITSTAFDVILTVYGVPFKTQSTLLPAGKDAEGNPVPERPRSHKEADGASIDAELTVLGLPSYTREGMLNNPYFQKKEEFTAGAFGMFLVGRIDAPSPETCIRMINDAVATEETGLYGLCFLDKAHKGGGYTGGDDWLDKISSINKEHGIPTVTEDSTDVYVTNYPMNDAALYFGWYSHHFSGPFRNTEQTFKPGSVIVHIHSYSAANIRTADAHWTGPILERGATCTLGNVHEPFLHLTTHLDNFYAELIAGKTLVEAAWSSTPSLSWHNVVLGDPLYRPFKNSPDLTASPYAKLKELAPIKTKSKFTELLEKAESAESAELHEAIGLIYTTLNAHEKCLPHFKKAEKLALSDDIKARNLIHQIAYHQQHQNNEMALTLIKANQLSYRDKPVEKALLALKNIISPPPPPPVEHPDKGQ